MCKCPGHSPRSPQSRGAPTDTMCPSCPTRLLPTLRGKALPLLRPRFPEAVIRRPADGRFQGARPQMWMSYTPHHAAPQTTSSEGGNRGLGAGTLTARPQPGARSNTTRTGTTHTTCVPWAALRTQPHAAVTTPQTQLSPSRGNTRPTPTEGRPSPQAKVTADREAPGDSSRLGDTEGA